MTCSVNINLRYHISQKVSALVTQIKCTPTHNKVFMLTIKMSHNPLIYIPQSLNTFDYLSLNQFNE